MKVRNMESSRGNKIANQFVITTYEDGQYVEYFQSYRTVIVRKEWLPTGLSYTLDNNAWDYSVTTGKYRNIFLGETKKETQAKIDSGEYKLADLN